jgi:hypothetical protein
MILPVSLRLRLLGDNNQRLNCRSNQSPSLYRLANVFHAAIRMRRHAENGRKLISENICVYKIAILIEQFRYFGIDHFKKSPIGGGAVIAQSV